MTNVGGAGGAVRAAPRVWLRLEGFAVFALAAWTYGLPDGWVRFVALFLIPDLSFAAYAAGPRVGAIVYNTMHSYVLPLLLLGAGNLLDTRAVAIALIWLAHIGFDRMLGYGLKYPDAFGHTHLGRIGKGAAREG